MQVARDYSIQELARTLGKRVWLETSMVLKLEQKKRIPLTLMDKERYGQILDFHVYCTNDAKKAQMFSMVAANDREIYGGQISKAI